MQNIDLICVGKLNASYYAAGVAEYQKRLAGFCNFRILELPEAAIADKNASDKQIEKALQKEGEAILRAVRKGAFLVALCVEGKQISSESWPACWRSAPAAGQGTLRSSSVPPTGWTSASSAPRRRASAWGASPCRISWPAWC